MSQYDSRSNAQALADILSGKMIWDPTYYGGPRPEVLQPGPAPAPKPASWQDRLRGGLRAFSGMFDGPSGPISPEMEAALAALGPEERMLALQERERYNANFRAARARAVANGAQWYNMDDIARGEAEQQYTQGMDNAMKRAEAMREVRRKSQMREQVQKILQDMDLTPSQKEFLQAAGPEVASEILSEYLFPDPGKNLRSQYGMGNINPGDFTAESVEAYKQSIDPRTGIGDYSLLRRIWAPAKPTITDINQVPTIVDPNSGRTNPLSDLPTEASARETTAAAEASGRTAGQLQAEAADKLPNIRQSADQMRSVANQLKKADLRLIYGPAGVAPPVPGTPQADAYAVWDRLRGQLFMKAYETLKGGGQITEIEGEKATAAMTVLSNRFIRPETAREALDTLISEIDRLEKIGIERARARPAGGQPQGGAPADPLGLRGGS